MVCFPNAKINLGLLVTSKRPDGYHNLESVFLPIPIYDVLEVVPASDNVTTLNVLGAPIAGLETDNLVWKAYQLLLAEYRHKMHPIDIILKKTIPMGAGMGGGSSNGAFMLILLNNYFELGLSTEQLLHFALQLGSDCPFFIINTPQWVQGRGELLNAINMQLLVDNYKILCVHPSVHISTKEAFAQIQPNEPTVPIATIVKNEPETWKENLVNDFENSFFNTHPDWKWIKEDLYTSGAIYVAMTGTGSTFYAVYPKHAVIGLGASLLEVPHTWCHDLIIKN